jgi:hypothetical protein
VAKKQTGTSRAAAGKKAQRADTRARVAAARRAEERRERRRRAGFISVAGVVAAGLIGGAAWGIAGHGGSDHAAAATALPTSAAYGSTTALPPWGAPADATAGARAAGLTVGSAEGTAVHFHTHLDVIVDGKPVTVPADLGIDEQAQELSELHTHDTSGVLHIEAPAKGRWVLGQLFDEWGVRLDADQVGGLKVGAGKALTAYVDGKMVSGNPATIELTPHREIALVYGPTGAKVTVPSSYNFPSGL